MAFLEKSQVRNEIPKNIQVHLHYFSGLILHLQFTTLVTVSVFQANSKGMTNTVCTLFELVNGDDTEGEGKSHGDGSKLLKLGPNRSPTM